MDSSEAIIGACTCTWKLSSIFPRFIYKLSNRAKPDFKGLETCVSVSCDPISYICRGLFIWSVHDWFVQNTMVLKYFIDCFTDHYTSLCHGIFQAENHACVDSCQTTGTIPVSHGTYDLHTYDGVTCKLDILEFMSLWHWYLWTDR